MDDELEAAFRERGWVPVGDDLLSPELIELIRIRISDSADGAIPLEEFIAHEEHPGTQLPGAGS